MTTPPSGRKRGRVSGRLLWILATALGGATLVAAASIVHDTARRETAAQLVARATAEQAAALATERLNVAALGRRELVPASSGFSVDIATKHLVVSSADSTSSALPPSALLTELALDAAASARPPHRFTIRMTTDPRLGERAIVTAVDFDSSGAPVTVHGLVARARDMASLLFARMITDPPVVDKVKGLVTLDSGSLEVRTADGRVLFGSLDDTRRYRSTVRAIGPLAGLTISVAIAGAQIPRAFVAGAPRMEYWHLGMLFFGTTVMIAAAAGLSRKELALARARSDFVAGVSHDLRMPLAQILLASETLTMQRERDVGERLRLTTSIVREAKRLISLVENVLLFSRSGAVEFTPKLVPLSVQSLFADVVDAVQLAVDDAGQQLDVADTGSLAVSGDRQLVRQALVNLVDNALKYGSRGSHVRLTAAPRGSDVVHLFVDDEGPGIPAAERARVFEAYERLARDQTSERTGSGLGLAVVRHVARSCGGDAWLEARLPTGTRAVIELRAARLAEPAAEPSGVA